MESGKQEQFAIGENDASWVTVIVGSTSIDDPDLGPITDDTCMLFASPGTGQPDKILTWLQLKDVDYSKGVTFPFEDTRTGPEVINPLEVRNRKRAFAAGTLRIINILPLQDGVRLMFMTPRPAKPAPNAAAHPSPP